ncbi:CBS domain-containing protein CBSX1, chloroplastic-like isoform X2 [Cynara cardunculus var. scolymus]|uniref:CBS domain-containing protein CBSX1, chloroplastic-like isoform X2 n=1 Tax=Cynara cardunculus var. scolymus TaxID=59895 RepID=UPI000D629359|nr:CBS domain-containing protein CBSX1, chloroplastic-like isoform X2 [Cynara cardunculus var. scolymus]
MASTPPVFDHVSVSLLRTTAASLPATAFFHHQMPSLISSHPVLASRLSSSCRLSGSRRPALTVAAAATLMSSSVPKSGVLIVGDFMTKKEDLHVVKPTTTVDEALKALVENRITGFPVIDDDWKLVGVVSDYDLLALDSISGTLRAETDMFPEVDSTWKTFNEVQRLLSKTDGKVVGDLMTYAPLVVRENTNLEDAASLNVRLLLETKYRRLPVVDGEGKLVGIITRGNVVRAALKIKKENEMKA